ncbi:MAG: TonB-dependent receptor [Bryobacteraceae bacterium]
MSRNLRLAVLSLLAAAAAFAQAGGTLRGTVTLESNGGPIHHASVLIVQLGRSAETDDEGRYEFRGVPPGTYSVIARIHALQDERKTVKIAAESAATLDFRLRLDALRQEVTVTASGREETSLEAMQSVTTLESLDLNTKMATSLGDVLDNETGIAKRSFGPGSSRPVIRGFDGDRVLILENGIRTGTLSSQSGDHGEAVDAAGLERLEVVRGPATLLYGTNALGGVVNAITRHSVLHQHPEKGLKGFMTGTGGMGNALGGGTAGFDFGLGNWLIWGGGGGLRSGDYNTPLGEIENSHSRNGQTNAGFGRYGEKTFFSLDYRLFDSRYGVPTAPEEEHGHDSVDLKVRRQTVRFNGGVRNIGSMLDRFQLTLNYSDYNHRELEGSEIGTEFFNKQFVHRAVFDQSRGGIRSGSFGFWGMHRDYKAVGEEALAPPTRQNAVAAFGLQSFDFERVRFQVGGRVERNGYKPDGLRSRSFTGFSGSAGMSVPIATSSAFVASYSHSYRAPALEELYNRGPHFGNLTFEIGNADLMRERSDGIDLSLRHQSRRLRGEANFFYYRLKDFVYLAPTGEIEEGLIGAEYRQADSRYTGFEGRLEAAVHNNLWLNLGLDTVNARLRPSNTPLPRIPPVRGRFGLDARFGGLSVRPELQLAADQSDVFTTEERTAGYGVFNLSGSYTVVRQHSMHVFSAMLFNAGDRLYRNHLSFIKAFAPEIGRGVKFSYTIRFF